MVNKNRTTEHTAAELARRNAINHARWQSKAVVGLLSALHLLSAADQQSTLEVSARLVGELAQDLAALVEVAA